MSICIKFLTYFLYTFLYSGQYQGYSHAHVSKRNSVGNNNMADYGEDAESDASTMTSASGTCVGYYDADRDQSSSTRNSRSRIATMSAENIASRSSSVPGMNYNLPSSCFSKSVYFILLLCFKFDIWLIAFCFVSKVKVGMYGLSF